MADWIDDFKEALFPFLTRDLYEKTSEETPDFKYNCVAHALGESDKWWQPPDPDDEEPLYFWPEGIPKDGTIASYVQFFELRGFSLCEPAQEPGFDRIALYAYPDGQFAHVAIQLPNGSWSSKLGAWEDIKHATFEALQGDRPAYGFVLHFMRREL